MWENNFAFEPDSRYQEPSLTNLCTMLLGSFHTIPVPGIWALGGLLLIYFLQRFLNDPLRRIPGPFIARFTNLWIVAQCRLLRRSQVVVNMHRKYGKFVRISPNHISISDPKAMQEIYGHKAAFTKGPFYDAFFQVRPVIFTARDPKVHSIKRKYLNAGFSARALTAFESRMDKNIRNLKYALIKRCVNEASPRLDFCTWSNYLAFDVIADFAFGKPFGFLLSEKDPENLVHVIDTRGEVLNALGHVPVWLRPYMKYLSLDKFWSKGLAARSNLETLGRQSYQERKARSGDATDLLGLLFSVKNPQNGDPLKSEEIIAEAISFIVGGSDTTSSTMTNFVDMVSRRPDIQKRLQDELDAAFVDTIDEEWIASDAVAGTLPYLNAVLKEVMRTRPTSSTGLERVVPVGGREIAGHFFPENVSSSVAFIENSLTIPRPLSAYRQLQSCKIQKYSKIPKNSTLTGGW